jgi:hypothetical protein
MEVLPELLYFDGVFPDATGEPPRGLFRCPKMESFRAEGLQFERIPSLEGWPNLKSLAFINNNVTSPLPSFANKARLQDVLIQGNPLQQPASGGTARFFDNCAELTSVTITDTDISDLFLFVGSTKITTIDLSHNEIDSSFFPESWNELKKMQNIDLSFNKIRRTNRLDPWDAQYAVSPLKGMTTLSVLDLSHNEIFEEVRAINAFMTNLIDPFHGVGQVQNFDVSHNKLWVNETEEIGGRKGFPAIRSFNDLTGYAVNSFSFHHNRLAGVVALHHTKVCKYNVDIGFNRIAGLEIGDSPANCIGKHTPSLRYDFSNQVHFSYISMMY